MNNDILDWITPLHTPVNQVLLSFASLSPFQGRVTVEDNLYNVNLLLIVLQYITCGMNDWQMFRKMFLQ